MTDESSAGTLVLVGAILQLIFSIVFLLIGGLLFIGMLFLFEAMELFEILWVVLIPLFFLIGGGISLIFTILWFNWRSHPSRHKTGLIITGILALILGGVIAGLLVLIGGAIAPSAESA